MIQLGEQDYKYVIQDFSNVYVGAQYSYAELAESDDTPSRLKDAVYRVFYKEVDPQTKIAEHLMQLKDDTMCYLAFSQLRLQIKVTFCVQRQDKKGKYKEEYETKDYSLDDFLTDNYIREHQDTCLIQEIYFKKRHLMMMHV